MVDFYDELTYETNPFPETHPGNLAVLGRLFGISTTDPHQCRVLELGSATGGNIIPMAWYLPASEFIGVELSSPSGYWSKYYSCIEAAEYPFGCWRYIDA